MICECFLSHVTDVFVFYQVIVILLDVLFDCFDRQNVNLIKINFIFGLGLMLHISIFLQNGI